MKNTVGAREFLIRTSPILATSVVIFTKFHSRTTQVQGLVTDYKLYNLRLNDVVFESKGK